MVSPRVKKLGSGPLAPYKGQDDSVSRVNDSGMSIESYAAEVSNEWVSHPVELISLNIR